jgi:hypothetical protein
MFQYTSESGKPIQVPRSAQDMKSPGYILDREQEWIIHCASFQYLGKLLVWGKTSPGTWFARLFLKWYLKP